ncbi:MAG: aldo/keto reductase [Solirubrobacterales bacterium]|nr:aldo/keto reductase [Solirubrobacterales bacterium]
MSSQSSPVASVAEALALGTAQLGQPYGIANRTGQPNDETASAVLELASSLGIRYVDTAQGYGRSEEIIGRWLQRRPESTASNVRVISKLSPALDPADTGALAESLEGSWARLGAQPIWGMLLHTEALLDRWEGRLAETLRDLRERGRITHMGVSVASVEGMRKAIEMRDMEIIQAPANVFDRRMRRAGLFALAQAAGKHVFIRSVFLQGLMLLDPAEAARRLPLAAGAVERLDAFCAEHMADRREFAVGYARQHVPGALLVIGSETPAQVAENCRLIAQTPPQPQLYEEWDAVWPNDDPVLVNPARWPVAQAR